MTHHTTSCTYDVVFNERKDSFSILPESNPYIKEVVIKYHSDSVETLTDDLQALAFCFLLVSSLYERSLLQARELGL